MGAAISPTGSVTSQWLLNAVVPDTACDSFAASTVLVSYLLPVRGSGGCGPGPASCASNLRSRSCSERNGGRRLFSSLSSSLRWQLPQRLVDLARSPEPVHEHRELAGDGDNRPFSSQPRGERHTPAPQVALAAEGAEDVMGTLDQEATQEGVAGLCDVQLGLALTRLPSLACETEIGADFPTLGEARVVLKRQDEGQRCENTNAV